MKMAEERSRKAAKGWLTRVGKKLQDLLAVPACDRKSEWRLEASNALTEFSKRLDMFDAAQTAVEAVIDEESLMDDIDKSGLFRDELIKLQTHLVTALHAAEAAEGSETGSRTTNVKLPKLNLPTFDGQTDKWLYFWESFESCVDQSNLPEVQKLSYLKGLLKGEAARAVAGLTLAASSYQPAVEILKLRYGKPEKLIFIHVQGLLNPEGSDLSALQDSLMAHIRSLESLGVDRDRYGVVLTPLVLSKLPEEVRMEWARTSEGHEGDLTHLLTFLNEEICRRERSGQCMELGGRRSGPVTVPVCTTTRRSFRRPMEARESSAAAGTGAASGTSWRVPESRQPAAAALAAPTREVVSGCGFCQLRHSTDRCPDWLRLSCRDRFQQVKYQGLCFCCLGSGHSARTCKARCAHCNGRHHVTCCLYLQGSDDDRKPVSSVAVGETGVQGRYGGPRLTQGVPSATKPVPSVASGGAAGVGGQGSWVGPKPPPGVSLSCNTGGRCTLLPTASVDVMSSSGPVKAQLIFDSGSDRTYVSERLMKKVSGQWKGSVEMSYAAFGGSKSSGVCNVFELELTGSNLSVPVVQKIQAVEVPVICAPLMRPSVETHLLQFFAHVEMADDLSSGTPHQIDILVGQDTYWSLVRTGLIRSPEGLVAQETAFGWVLSGLAEGPPGSTGPGNPVCQLLTVADVPGAVRSFWSLEGFGADDDPCDESSVMADFTESVRQCDDSRYEVELPWRKDGSVSLLQDNRGAAESRLASLSRKLDRDPSLQERYDAALQEMEDLKVIHEVPSEEMETDNPIFYLPHRPVVKVGGSTKVRPVFDASAKGANGLSLNDCLEIGPPLTPNVLDVLLRFRRWKFGISADIVKAFLQIRLAAKDRDVHRFLWNRKGQVRVMRFERVTFGLGCSPFLLNATIQHHLSQYEQSPLIREMRDNFYVDDWLSGSDSEMEAKEMLGEASSVMKAAGMELSKYCSNSPVLFSEIVGGPVENSVKVLGVTWRPDDDTFSFVGQCLPDSMVPTKRLVLSLIARLFDPLGFLTPFAMVAKCLFQELWERKLDWDDPLPADCADLFCRWMADFQRLEQVKVPRCFTAGTAVDWTSSKVKELHVFADASPRGYGAVVYIRVLLPDGTFAVSLVLSKGRVAPLKRLTLPRLELLGCVMAARLVQHVRKVLRLPSDTRCVYWSDSMIALGWIRGRPQRWKQFVANRVREIQNVTKVESWLHCRSEDNPADLTTRGVLAEALMSSCWFGGPQWLSQPDAQLRAAAETEDATPSPPAAAGTVGSEEEEDLFLAAADAAGETEAVTLGSPDEEVASGEAHLLVAGADEGPMLDVTRFGSFSKATRVVGWMLRFLRNARRRDRCSEPDLTSDELASGRDMLFRLVQADSFPAEVKALKEGKGIPVSSPIFNLSPFMADDGFMRVRGRLQFSELSFEAKHPVILPKGHLACLLVREQHQLMHHAGVATLMTAVRSEFWVVGLRAIARRVVRSCIACRRQDAPACSEQTAPLPGDRVTRAPPFSVCGVDFAGPVFSVDFPRKKLYICLLTCAVTRAVHLEVTESLSLEHFVMALRRFAARRGVPATIYSDNARTFVGADVLLRRYFGRLAPHWRFIAPLSPWWGGWWERLIRSVKIALRKSLGTRCLTRTELETVMCEVEACVNSRPLTFQGDTVDCPNPLTPNHFLTGHSVGFQAKVAESPSSVTPRVLGDRARVREMRLNKFWNAWTNDYLRNLPPAVRGKAQGDLAIGSLVLIHEEKTPRLSWEIGMVTRLFPGRDGRVRSAEVRTGRGLKTRAVQRLHSLELAPSYPS